MHGLPPRMRLQADNPRDTKKMIHDSDWFKANVALRVKTAVKAVIPDGAASIVKRRLSHSSRTDPLERWRVALPSEVDFWRGIIYGTFPNREWVNDMKARVRGITPFPEHLLRYLEGKTGSARILDVGSGPVTVLSGVRDGIEVVAVDPLADDYNRLLDKKGLVPRIRTLRGDGEKISELGLGLFDLVYSRNALDHSYDPIRAIREMLKVCSPAGFVFFEGETNESIREHGIGLHQWNFLPVDNGDLIVWQMDKEALSLRHALGEGADVKASGKQSYQVEIKRHF
jgi:SAM-dependent methyltransferase